MIYISTSLWASNAHLSAVDMEVPVPFHGGGFICAWIAGLAVVIFGDGPQVGACECAPERQGTVAGRPHHLAPWGHYQMPHPGPMCPSTPRLPQLPCCPPMLCIQHKTAVNTQLNQNQHWETSTWLLPGSSVSDTLTEIKYPCNQP